MAQISVTPEELKQQATIYTEASEDIKATLQKVSDRNGLIEQEWQGAAFKAYLEQYDVLAKEVQDFEELLVKINQQLNQFADDSEEFDNNNRQRFATN